MHVDAPGAMTRQMAQAAVHEARARAPKVSGDSSVGFMPIWGDGFFGISWTKTHVWFQEMGIRPFTMNALAGKTVPMWITDDTGTIRSKNPKARTRITVDGRTQALIFRKAALPGQRKTVTRRVGGEMREVSVPRSYPGAPGRISRREPAPPNTSAGKLAGQIAKGNVGVRWRHPGMDGKHFLREGLTRAAERFGITPGPISYATQADRPQRTPSI